MSTRAEEAKRDRLISQGAHQFMSTLARTTQTRAIVITVQPDGYTQIHTTIKEPDMTRHLMRAAAGDRKGEVIQ